LPPPAIGYEEAETKNAASAAAHYSNHTKILQNDRNAVNNKTRLFHVNTMIAELHP
jgi:hypothetical protein